MKILLDTNVILDIMLKREPFVTHSEQVLQVALQSNFTVFLTATTITDVYYLVRKASDKTNALTLLNKLLQFVEVAAVDKHVILQALTSSLADFEDAVQVSSANNAGIELIVTRNIQDFRHAPIEVHTPESFLAKLN